VESTRNFRRTEQEKRWLALVSLLDKTLSMPPSLRPFAFLRAAVLMAAGASLISPLIAADAGHPAPASATRPSPGEALKRLLDGNARFVAGHAEHPHQTVARRVELAGGQAPFAVVLTCSDSRVAPEFYFDQGLGDLFVVRDAGNTLNDQVVGSIEYAVEHLHASVIIVVGHEKCGAVGAALAGGRAEGHLGSILDAIKPAVINTRNQAGDKLDNAVSGHARLVSKALAASAPILARAVQSGEIRVYAAHYALATGQIEILP
jgi:carbonic anhydrase